MRRKRVVESSESAANCIGPIEQDMSLFAITRGQFRMIDAIFHVLHEAGPAARPLPISRLRLTPRAAGESRSSAQTAWWILNLIRGRRDARMLIAWSPDSASA